MPLEIALFGKISSRCEAVVRAAASHSVDLGLICQLNRNEDFENCIHSFSARRLAPNEESKDKAGKLACRVLGKST